VIALVFVTMWKRAPIHERMIPARGGRDEFLLRLHADAAGWAPDIELAGAGFSIAQAAVVNLAGGEGAIPVCFEVLRQRDAIAPRFDRAKPWSQTVNAGRRGAKAEHEAGARRIAEGRLAMGVQHRGAARGEAIQVWRLDQRVSAERADPVILVIDRDKEDVRLGGRSAECGD
jgi:hypothetical protein